MRHTNFDRVFNALKSSSDPPPLPLQLPASPPLPLLRRLLFAHIDSQFPATPWPFVVEHGLLHPDSAAKKLELQTLYRTYGVVPLRISDVHPILQLPTSSNVYQSLPDATKQQIDAVLTSDQTPIAIARALNSLLQPHLSHDTPSLSTLLARTRRHRARRLSKGLLSSPSATTTPSSTTDEPHYSYPPGVPFCEPLLNLTPNTPSPSPSHVSPITPRPPSFPPAPPTPSQPSLHSLIPECPLFATANALESVRGLRKRLVVAIRTARADSAATSLSPASSTPPPQQQQQQQQQPNAPKRRKLATPTPSVNQLLAQSSIALVMAGLGYTHIGSGALQRFSNAVGVFLEGIGKELKRLKREEGDMSGVYDVICDSVKGGKAGMVAHITRDMPRVAQSVLDARMCLVKRCRMVQEKTGRVVQIGSDEGKDSQKGLQDDGVETRIDVDEELKKEQAVFGYLGGGWIDLLGGVKVPVQMIDEKTEESTSSNKNNAGVAATISVSSR